MFNVSPSRYKMFVDAQILIPNKKQTSQKEYAIIVKGDDYGKEI